MIGFVMCGKPRFSGEWVRLGDICNVRSGGTPKRSVSEYWDKGTIPWVKIGDISSKYISAIEENISEAGLKNSAAKLFQPGILLFSIFASIGAVGILTVPAATNQAIAGLEIKSNIINRDYLYYFLKASEMGAKRSGRGVAQNNINLSILRDMKVPVPSLAEQSAIAREFERIDCQIDNANNQLSSLDALVKSRFNEVFGPYIDEDKQMALSRFCELVTVGIANAATHAYADDGIVMLRNLNVRENQLDDSDLIRIRPDFAAKYGKKALKAGDVLVTRTGYPGIACVVPERYAGCQTFTTLIARLKSNAPITPLFLSHWINSPKGKEFVARMKAGSSQQNFGASSLKLLPVPLPPLVLQQQFAVFVQQVDKLRFMLLGTLRLYIAAVHFVAQQKVAMAGLF